MKTLLYNETSQGNLILVGVGEASADPLETKNKAIEHAQASPKFAELKARINNYNEYLEKCKAEGIKFADDDTVPPAVRAELRNRLLVVSGLQTELIEIKDKYARESPVYMKPASSLLVEDQVAEDIGHVLTEGKVVVLRIDKNGGYAGYDLIDDNRGKKYREHNSQKWHYIYEPDIVIPAGMRVDDPDEAELSAMNVARIKALSAEEKQKEKDGAILGSKYQYGIDVIAADLEDSPEAIEKAKAEARAQYDARLKDIEIMFA